MMRSKELVDDIEIALWNTIGAFLDGSGWTTALCDVGIARAETVDSFLKACHLMRTRHGHQVTLLALSNHQFDAWQATFEAWRKRLASTSPTFKYWDIIYQFEILMCIFIRAQRTGNFNLYLDALEALVPWFFALDHINYARWIPVHIRDMKFLPDSIQDEFQRFWAVQKTSNVFSSIPIDQAHEQNNHLVKQQILELISINVVEYRTMNRSLVDRNLTSVLCTGVKEPSGFFLENSR